VLSTAAGTAPAADYVPAELRGRVGTVATFTAAPEAVLSAGRADATLTARLAGDMMSYDWTINGRPYGQAEPLRVQQGRTVDLVFVNDTTMWHPMHLHGHTFEVLTADGRPGPRKDTLIVLPRQRIGVRLVTDNPGTWMLHCHNTYHQAAGMMTTLDYVAG
jgi:FtsP/CotA-like multicopper oxidase with cupredoxin domain